MENFTANSKNELLLNYIPSLTVQVPESPDDEGKYVVFIDWVPYLDEVIKQPSISGYTLIFSGTPAQKEWKLWDKSEIKVAWNPDRVEFPSTAAGQTVTIENLYSPGKVLKYKDVYLDKKPVCNTKTFPAGQISTLYKAGSSVYPQDISFSFLDPVSVTCWISPGFFTNQDITGSCQENGQLWNIDRVGNIFFSADAKRFSLARESQDNYLYNSILKNDSTIIAAGSQGSIVYSLDTGENWNNEIFGTNDFQAITWTGTTYVIVGKGGTIITGIPGSWTQQTVGTTRNLYDVAFLSNKKECCVVGQDGIILRSSNYVDWIIDTTPTTLTLQSVTNWDNYLFACGKNGILIVKPEDDQWLQRDTGISETLNSICFDGTRMIVVGNQPDEESNGVIITTSDKNGVLWTVRNSILKANLLTVTATDRLIAVAGVYGEMATCLDIETFTPFERDNYFFITLQETLQITIPGLNRDSYVLMEPKIETKITLTSYEYETENTITKPIFQGIISTEYIKVAEGPLEKVSIQINNNESQETQTTAFLCISDKDTVTDMDVSFRGEFKNYYRLQGKYPESFSLGAGSNLFVRVNSTQKHNIIIFGKDQ